MKIGIIGDIHGNLPALEAVLDEIDAAAVDAIWNVGDHVGYGPFPAHVCHRIAEREIVSIAGNYDLKCLKAPRKRKKWRKKKTPEKAEALIWAHDHLSPGDRDWLGGLATTVRLAVEDRHVLICHANPGSDNDPIFADTSIEQFEAYAEIADADVIVFGHSHEPVFQTVMRDDREVVFINPGPVGRPEDGDPRACYAIAEMEAGRIEVEYFRVEYDLARLATAVRAAGLGEAFVHCFTQASKLDRFIGKHAGELPPEPAENVTAEQAREAVLFLAECCDYEADHTHQVTKLALNLFDELADEHGYEESERRLLEYGALLHDIGWIHGQRKHHKTARDIIIGSYDLPFSHRERRIVAMIARYHRRAAPKSKHKIYRDLDESDQQLVRTLAGILRVADGLDRTHRGSVVDLTCDCDGEAIIIRCDTKRPAAEEKQAAMKKSDVFCDSFERELRVEV